MSLVTASVSVGYTFVSDVLGRILILKDRLNSLGTPTVVVDLADAVATGDLTSALSNLIAKPTFTVGAESSDAIEVTIQMKNTKSESVAQTQKLRVWLADTPKAGETATTPSGDLTVTTGTELKEVTSKEQLIALTNSSGVAVIKVDQSGGATHTWYLNAVGADGIVYASGAITITI